MGAKAIIPSGDADAMKEAAGEPASSSSSSSAAQLLNIGCCLIPPMGHCKSCGCVSCSYFDNMTLFAAPGFCCSWRILCARPPSKLLVVTLPASAGTLDGIIDTVSAKHDLTALTALLTPLVC
jgi:hypothetical protein